MGLAIVVVIIILFMLFIDNHGFSKITGFFSSDCGKSLKSAAASAGTGVVKAATPVVQNVVKTVTEPMVGDYHEYMVSTGLESSVIDSHGKFTDEIKNMSSGASVETQFSHNEDIVTTWGLPRKLLQPTISASSREVPSLTNEQITENAKRLKGYQL